MTISSKNKLDYIVKNEKYQLKLLRYINFKGNGKLILIIFPLLLTVSAIMLYLNFLGLILETFTGGGEESYNIRDLISTRIPVISNFGKNNLDYKILLVFFQTIIILNFLYFILLLYWVSKTYIIYKIRLDYEKSNGKVIENFAGYKTFKKNFMGALFLLLIISILALFSELLFIVFLYLEYIIIGLLAIGTLLFVLYLSFYISSLNLDLYRINGLQDFFKPIKHNILVFDYPITEIIENHLDPLSYLKWEEYYISIRDLVQSKFQKNMKDNRKIKILLEKILLLYYLEYQKFLTKEQVREEFKKILIFKSDKFDIKKGWLNLGNWYFSKADFNRIFNFIEHNTPEFFDIINNINLIYKQTTIKNPIYLDVSTQEEIQTYGDNLNLIIFILNLSLDNELFELKIDSPGYKPDKFHIKLRLDISEVKSLILQKEKDIIEILSSMMSQGKFLWFNLAPINKGEQSIHIRFEKIDGEFILGKNIKSVIRYS